MCVFVRNYNKGCSGNGSGAGVLSPCQQAESTVRERGSTGGGTPSAAAADDYTGDVLQQLVKALRCVTKEPGQPRKTSLPTKEGNPSSRNNLLCWDCKREGPPDEGMP